MEHTGKILQIIGNETRRKILTLLSQEPRYISEIAKKLDITQPAILKHLSILEEAGLIESFKKNSPIGAARKYYRICHTVDIEVAINPKGFRVNKQPQITICPKYDKREQTIKQLTEQIKQATDIATKANKARELIKATELLLACKDFEKGKKSCEICHQIAILRKETSQIILYVSNGEIESGLHKLIEVVNQLSKEMQPARKE